MTKHELLHWAETRKDDLIRLTSEMIRINSENPTGTQRNIVDYVEAYLKKAGIDYEETGENPEFPCVVAKLGSDDGYSLIINGHVDVVPAGDLSKWDFDPYCGTVTDTQILGRGTSDMKAGMAGALFAMALIKESGIHLGGNIRLHVVSDEESGGEFGTAWLCEHGYADQADGCIVAEPTSMATIEIGQKGGLLLVIRAHGQSAHGSLGNYKGENAILKMGKVLPLVEKLTRIKGHYTDRQQKPLADSKMIAEDKNEIPGLGDVIDHVTTNIGLIKGGTRHNMVPDNCEVTVDCRLPIGVDPAEIAACVEEIKQESGVTGVEFELNYRSEPNFTDHEDPLVLAIKHNVEALLGTEVVPAYQWASSDARDYRKKGISTIQFGPSNTVGIHSYNETVQIADVVTAAKAYLAAIYDLMGIEV